MQTALNAPGLYRVPYAGPDQDRANPLSYRGFSTKLNESQSLTR